MLKKLWVGLEARASRGKRRKKLREYTKKSIEKLAKKDARLRTRKRKEKRTKLYDDLDHGWKFPDGLRVDLNSGGIYLHILAYLQFQATLQGLVKEGPKTREWYRKLFKGKGSRTTEPKRGYRSAIISWDSEGKLVVKLPGDKWHRSPDKAKKRLIQGIYVLLSSKRRVLKCGKIRGLPQKEKLNLARHILDAFCGIKMKDKSIKRALMPDRADNSS